MKYMLMMHAGRGKGDWGVLDWAPQDLKAHIDFMLRLNKDLTESGELVGAEGLAGPAEARVVRATKGGAPAVDADGRLAGHYRLDAVRAHLLEMAGDDQAAIERYRTAAERTASLPERSYLISRAARLTARRTTGEGRNPDAEPRDLDREQPDRP